MKILSYRRFALWWQLAMDWFQRQFAAIAASIDFTPVEEKLDDIKNDVSDVKSAVEDIDFSPLAKDATVAKEANATSNKRSIMGYGAASNTGDIAAACKFRPLNSTLYSIQKQSDDFYIYSDAQPGYFPVDYGVGSKIKVGTLGEEDVRLLVKSVDNPYVTKDSQNRYVLHGVTDWMWMHNHESYICTGVVPITYTPEGGGQSVIGTLYLYDKYLEEVSTRDVLNAVNEAQQDMSSVAKQGTNPDATNTAILAAIGQAGGGDAIKIMTDAEYAPALEDLNDMIDALDEEES